MTFDGFLRAHGLRPGKIAADGRWRRCPTEDHSKKRNGSYKLAIGGGIGWCQNWATMDSPAQWTAEKGSQQVAAPDRARMLADHRRMMAEREQAVQRARAYYQAARPLRDGHPYLDSHGLDMRGCYGLRVDSDGWLVVPAYIDRQIVSYQRISPDGQKRFAKGAPIQGSTYTIERASATLTIICEGLATGLALYHALTDSRIVVCWHTSNLTAAKVRRGMRVIAADNDHATEERIGKNPGLEAAQKAAAHYGCGVAYPDGLEGSDWCDYRMEQFALRRLYPPPYESKAASQRIVDAKIRHQIMAAAKWA